MKQYNINDITFWAARQPDNSPITYIYPYTHEARSYPINQVRPNKHQNEKSNLKAKQMKAKHEKAFGTLASWHAANDIIRFVLEENYLPYDIIMFITNETLTKCINLRQVWKDKSPVFDARLPPLPWYIIKCNLISLINRRKQSCKLSEA